MVGRKRIFVGRAAALVAAVVVGLVGRPERVMGQPSTLREMFGAAQVTVTDDELSTPLGFDVFRDGSVVIAQFPDARVAKYSAAGKLLWRVGREGSGPGEYQQPYRVCALPDESVLVFDVRASAWTLLGPDGAFKRTMRPDLGILNPGSLLCAPNGSIYVSGVTRDPRGSRFAIHQFNASLEYQKSFGELPDTDDRQLLRHIGAGTLREANAQSFYHVRIAPYELVRFSWSGALQSRVAVPIRVDPPTAWQTFNGGSVKSNSAARRPITVIQLSPNRFLGGTSGGSKQRVLFDSTGKALDEAPGPADWSSVVGYDPQSATLWVYREPDDVPELVRVPVRIP